jgi:hypothetical protein
MNKKEKTLIIFIQELSEVIIEASKLMDKNNTDEDSTKFEIKIGSVFAVIAKLAEHKIIKEDDLIQYADKRLKSLTKWDNI